MIDIYNNYEFNDQHWNKQLRENKVKKKKENFPNLHKKVYFKDYFNELCGLVFNIDVEDIMHRMKNTRILKHI